jgi:replication-associated recombination protein RarA
MIRVMAKQIVSAVLVALCVAACAGAPVQEMSNARQAIRAARDAGAAKTAPQTLNEAQTLLDRAEGNLQRREYRDARRDAVAARDKASEALSSSRPLAGSAHDGAG